MFRYYAWFALYCYTMLLVVMRTSEITGWTQAKAVPADRTLFYLWFVLVLFLYKKM